jgi:hypothetical protein
VALDGDSANATPNIYVTSTSLFGLQIVAANGDRLVKGEPGARWMPGQFGLDKGGTPGSVWKIDGVTGLISLFANIEHDGKDNAGPGSAPSPTTPSPSSSSSATSKPVLFIASASTATTAAPSTTARPAGQKTSSSPCPTMPQGA